MPTSPFTAEAAARLDGPDWLRARRAAAAEQFAAAELPTSDEEVWRYSRIADLDLERYEPPAGAGGGVLAPDDAAFHRFLDALVDCAATVLSIDGSVVETKVADGFAAKGLVAARAADAEGAERVLGSVAGTGPDIFTSLNDAFADPVVVRVPAGVVVPEPIVVVHHAEAVGGSSFPRLVVELGDDAEATVVEVATSAEGDHLVVPVTELSVGNSARLRYVGVQHLALGTWQLGAQVSSVGQGATLRSASAAFGGEYARLRTDCHLVGRGATGDLLAVYFGEGDQTLDFRTFQEHAAPDTTSNLLFKGAVGGRSRSVYTGLIRVAKEARGTNAFQTNRNVKLSEHAWAESVPNLVIENNDVRCSHASAVGPVDEEQRFYLESRGVPTDVAERLIVTGFFDEVLAELPVADLASELRDTIRRKFERREA